MLTIQQPLIRYFPFYTEQNFNSGPTNLYTGLHPKASVCLYNKVSLNQFLLLDMFGRRSDESHLSQRHIIWTEELVGQHGKDLRQ